MQFAFFLIYIVAILICGSINVGPFSLRIYMSVLMLAYIIYNKTTARKDPYKIRTDYIYLFIASIAMLGIALIINGGLDDFNFWERSLAYYLLCIICYFAVDCSVKKINQFDMVIFVISLILLLDSVVTILQSQNSPVGWGLGAVLSEVDDYSDYLLNHESFVGVSKIPGIFGHPVRNGFFLGVATPMLLIGITAKKKPKIFSLFYICLIALSLYSLLLLQQRAAFFLLLLILAFHILRTFFKHPLKYLLPLAAIIIIVEFVIPFNIGETEMGRLATMDNSSRTDLWSKAFTVFADNPFWGNLLQYNITADYSAHSMLLDSLVCSGIIGFIPLFSLFMKTITDSIRIAKQNINSYTNAFSYSVIISMGMGLYHNTSYLTGEVMIFLSLALMFKAQILTKR